MKKVKIFRLLLLLFSLYCRQVLMLPTSAKAKRFDIWSDERSGDSYNNNAISYSAERNGNGNTTRFARG